MSQKTSDSPVRDGARRPFQKRQEDPVGTAARPGAMRSPSPPADPDGRRPAETDGQEPGEALAAPGLSAQYATVREHFDHAFYLRGNTDVASRGVDPVRHYLNHGAKEGRNPTPDFDTKYYLNRYPDVRSSGLNPFYHYLEIGRKEGRSPRYFSAGNPAFDAWCTELLQEQPAAVSARILERRRDVRQRLDRGALKEMVDRAAALEPLVRHASLAAMDAGISPFRSPQLTVKMLAMHRLHRAAKSRRAAAAVVVHWSHMLSGAARFAGFVAGALAEAYGPDDVVVLRTNPSAPGFHDCFPTGCRQVDFGRISRILDPNSRQQVLLEFLRSLRLRVVFNVNSALLWETLAAYGVPLAREVALYAALFTNVKTVHGDWNGYATRFFYRYFDLFRGVVTDNRFLAEKLKRQFVLTPAQQRRLVALETPVVDPPAPVPVPVPAPGERPRVFWASRFDREKRVDLVYAVARAMPDVHFHLWGKPVLDESFGQWPPAANVFLEGIYEAFEDLPLGRCHAWLYTSACDGVPNILLDVAAAGIPIVGSHVGGTGEVLLDGLSWPVRDIDNVTAYEEALRQVLADPEAAWSRALRLREHVLRHRTWSNFSARLRGLLP